MTTPPGEPQRAGRGATAEAVLGLLQKVPVFQFLGVQELGLVASRLGLTTYEAGKVIFEKDSSGTALQIIAAGSVKI